MDELMKEVVKLAQQVNALVNINITLAKRANEQDVVIHRLQERVAVLESNAAINKAMLH